MYIKKEVTTYPSWDSYLEIAATRWFQTEELLNILQSYKSAGYPVSRVKPTNPSNGSLYILDKRKVPDFKQDGIEYAKKKGTSKLKEDYNRLLLNGVHTLTGVYCVTVDDSGLKRRIYRFANDENYDDSNIVLIHYRCYHDKPRVKAEPIDSRSRGNSNPEVPLQRTDSLVSTSPFSMDIASDDDQLLEILSEFGAEPYQQPVSIVDFSPASDTVDGGSKILICLSSPLNVLFNNLEVAFTCAYNFPTINQSFYVPATLINPTVVRCHAPAVPATEKFFLTIMTDTKDQLTFPSSEYFQYMPSMRPVLPQGFNPNHNPRYAMDLRNNSWINNHTDTFQFQHHPPPPLPPIQHIQTPSFQNTSEMFPDQLLSQPFHLGSVSNETQKRRQVKSFDNNRVHKRRILESFMAANGLDLEEYNKRYPISLQHTSPGHSLGMSQDWKEDEWLDDNALSVLSNADLESLMEQFLFRIVRQLVQLATSDDDLQAELHSLDESGYSLLHYCCLFNMDSLIPHLVKKGVNVNQLTSCNTTALHLAAGSGNSNIVRQLLNSSAGIFIVDADGLNSIELAVQSNNLNVVNEFKDFFQANSLYQELEYVNSLMQEYSMTDDGSASPTDHLHSTPTSANTKSFFDDSLDLEAPDVDGADSQNLSFLYGAISSLSLAEKCALSKSFGSSVTNNHVNTLGNASVENFEVQSVLSETDKESLSHAMLMMSPDELSVVEEEVRLIQNNVRAWLLRKNYTNLREAVKTLQTAWREKKRYSFPKQNGQSTSSIQLDASGEVSTTSARLTPSSINEVAAASTLQAATRGMLARKNFQRVKSQAMATLVIQKRLAQWWLRNRSVSGAAPPKTGN